MTPVLMGFPRFTSRHKSPVSNSVLLSELISVVVFSAQRATKNSDETETGPAQQSAALHLDLYSWASSGTTAVTLSSSRPFNSSLWHLNAARASERIVHASLPPGRPAVRLLLLGENRGRPCTGLGSATGDCAGLSGQWGVRM